MNEETTASGNVAEAENTAPELSGNIEADTGAPPILDDYQQRVEQLLDHHEKKNEHHKETMQDAADKQEQLYENATLQEGESWDSIYGSMPKPVQRAMASLRADYTRKTQELSKQRRHVEDLQSNLTNSDAFKALQTQANTAAAEGEEFDPFDPKSFEAYVDRMVAQKLQGVLQPMYDEQIKTQSSRKVNDFMDQHPELRNDDDMRQQVYSLLKESEQMTLEQGYWIVKGKKAQQNQQQEKAISQKKREMSRQAASTIGSGRKSGLTAPPETAQMDAGDIYNYLLAQKK
tara:strand:- start:31 stop:897 length:867 start_codon:yes stop_codon:yes gene_type:complete